MKYLLTSAQNATNVDRAFLSALRAYADFRGAELLIAPVTYRNPTRPGEKRDDGWWDPEALPHMVREPVCLGDTDLVFHANARVQPTATKPTNGWETFLGKESAIIPHPKHQVKMVPSGRAIPRLVASTGSVTEPNYSDSRAGQKAARCHTVGALWVETRGRKFWVHQITWTGISFTHLGTRVWALGRGDATPAAALVLGDIHAAQIDMDVFQAGMTQAQLVRAEKVVLHDVFDGRSISHHHTLADKQRGRPTLDAELDKTAEILVMAARWVKAWGGEIVIAHSNHDRHLDQWLWEHKPDGGPNDLAYYELNTLRLRAQCKVPSFELAMALYLPACLKEYGMSSADLAPIRFLRPGEELIVKGVALHYHGDRGPNGARGSAQGFAGLGRKCTVGHAHTPQILDGCHVVGVTGRLDMDYTVGAPSSWLACSDVVYHDGHRSLLPIIEGQGF